jgi:tRNA dimethylallyltransferase
MVGGSGLYVDAVLKGLDSFPDIAQEIRKEVRTTFEEKGLDYLQNTLKELDPDYTNFLLETNPQTLQNPQRMMRFVEVCLSTGKAYSSFIDKKENTRNFTPIVIGLEADREILYNRINQRVAKMLNQGQLQEAQRLFPNKELNALQTVGYREFFDYLEGKITLDFAVEEIKKNTRRFSKRQLTWFKRTENAIWFDFLADRKEIINSLQFIIDNS